MILHPYTCAVWAVGGSWLLRMLIRLLLVTVINPLALSRQERFHLCLSLLRVSRRRRRHHRRRPAALRASDTFPAEEQSRHGQVRNSE